MCLWSGRAQTLQLKAIASQRYAAIIISVKYSSVDISWKHSFSSWHHQERWPVSHQEKEQRPSIFPSTSLPPVLYRCFTIRHVCAACDCTVTTLLRHAVLSGTAELVKYKEVRRKRVSDNINYLPAAWLASNNLMRGGRGNALSELPMQQQLARGKPEESSNSLQTSEHSHGADISPKWKYLLKCHVVSSNEGRNWNTVHMARWLFWTVA